MTFLLSSFIATSLALHGLLEMSSQLLLHSAELFYSWPGQPDPFARCVVATLLKDNVSQSLRDVVVETCLVVYW